MKQENLEYYNESYEDSQGSPNVSMAEASVKGAQASLASGDYSGSIYSQVTNEMLHRGKSDTVEQIKADVDSETRTDIVSDIIQTSPTPDFASEAIQKYVKEPVPIGVVAKEATTKYKTATQLYMEQLAVEEAKNGIRQLVDDAVKGQASSDDLSDVAKLLMPFYEQVQFQTLKSGKADGSFFFGSDVQAESDYFKSLDSAGKIDYMQGLKDRLVESGFDNAIAQMFAVEDIINGQQDWERWLNNLGTVLDSLGLGFVAKSAIKSATSAKSLGELTRADSAIETTSQSNPKLSQELSAAGIETEDAAEIVGSTNSSGIFNQTHMPHSTLDDDILSEGMSSGLAQKEKERRATQESIYQDSAGTGIRLSDEARATKIEEAKTKAEDVAVLYGDMKVEVKPLKDGEYFFMSIPIAKDQGDHTSSFFSAIDALNTGAKVGERYGLEPDDVVLMERNLKTKQFQEVTPDRRRELLMNDPEGEFITVINSVQRYDRKGTVEAEDAVKFGGTQRFLTIGGKNFSSYILDPANQFAKWVTSSIGVAADKATEVNKRLVDMIDKDFADLNTSQKQSVWNVVEQGNKSKRYYTAKELKQGITKDGVSLPNKLSDKEINAYMSVSRFWDTLWHLDNRTFNRKLIDEGMYRLSVREGEEVMFAKPLKARETTNKVLNPDTGEVMSGQQATSILREDGTTELFKLRYPRDGVEYVLRTPTVKGRAVRESDVSLAKIEGYVKRNYNSDYFIRKRTRDGKVSAVAAGSRFGDIVEKTIRFNKNADQGEEYFYTKARELESTDLDEVVSVVERGRSVERRRGEQLRDIQDLDETLNLAAIQNPIESMISAAASTSNAAVMYDTLRTMKGNFVKNFKMPNGQWPSSQAQVKDVFVNGVDKTAEAKAMFNYIEAMESTADRSIANHMFKDVLFNMSELIENSKLFGGLSGTTGEALRKLAKVDPIRAARTLPHVLFIAAAPIRQLVVQHSQLIQMLPLTKKYANPFNLMKDMYVMRALYAVKDDVSKFDKMVNKQAKWIGMDKTELRSLFKAFNESGLSESVHSNTMIERTFAMAGKDIYNSKVQHVAAKAGKAATLIPQYGQKYGFDVGEFNNLLGTFLVAYERSKGTVDLANKTDRAKLADDTRKMSWNMNSAGKFGYQYGLLSIPMQFVQVPHKALLNMITGSGVLSKEERMRVAAMNLTLFGSAGFGIDAILEPFSDDMSPEAYQAVSDGVLNKVLNSFSDFITGGDGSNVDWSASMNPISGYQDIMGAPVEALLSGQIEVGGAFFGAGSKVFRQAQSAKEMLMISNLDGDVTADEALAVTLEGLSVYSGFSHLAAFLLQSRTERLISNSGTDYGEATGAEIISKLAGMRTIEEQRAFDTLQSIRDVRKNYEQDMGDAVKRSMQASMKLRAYTARGEEAPQDLLMEMKLPADIMSLYSDADRAYGSRIISREFNRLNGNFHQQLMDSVSYNLMRVPSDSIEDSDVLRRLRAVQGTGTETQNKMVEETIQLFEGEQ